MAAPKEVSTDIVIASVISEYIRTGEFFFIERRAESTKGFSRFALFSWMALARVWSDWLKLAHVRCDRQMVHPVTCQTFFLKVPALFQTVSKDDFPRWFCVANHLDCQITDGLLKETNKSYIKSCRLQDSHPNQPENTYCQAQEINTHKISP